MPIKGGLCDSWKKKNAVEKYYFLPTTILWTPKWVGDFVSSEIMKCKLSPSASCTLILVENIEKWKQLE